MSFKHPLSNSSWEKNEIIALKKVISSKKFTMGNKVKKFEKNFAKYLGSKYCVMVNSGSSANLLMVASLFYIKKNKYRLKRGDEVFVPAVAWSTSYFPLYQLGLKLKFVDIDLFTLNYDLVKLQKSVNKKTRMILAVNLLGNSNDFNYINKIVRKNNIILVEDNCESLGAKYNGKFCGTFGLVGSHSFFFSHHISTMEGGAIVTDDKELYHILLSLRAHGWTRDLPDKNSISRKDKDPFKEMFNFILPGFNVRPLELSAAVGIEQLKRLPKIIIQRRKNGKLLQKNMKNHPNIIIQKEIGESSWFGFSILIKPSSKLKRTYLLNKMKKLGFECRPIVSGNFVKNKVIKYFKYKIFGELKNADYIDKNGFFVGNHHYPIPKAINLIKNIR